MSPITKLVGPGTTHASDTLYTRLGGEEKLDRIVTGVYHAMAADKEIGKQFARFNLTRLKDRTVDYLRGEFGGDEYKGSDLWISHSHLGVNNHWYDIMMKYYVQVLKKEKIAKQETQEVITSVEKMRVPIVDKGQKFKEMYLKWEEKQAAKTGLKDSGWGSTPVTKEEREKKERDTLALIAKRKEEEMMEEERRKMDAFMAAFVERPAPAAPKAKPKPKAKPTPKPKPKPTVDWGRFMFSPMEDEPPPSLPSSMPSAAEQMYRLVEYCSTPRAHPGTPRVHCSSTPSLTPRSSAASTPFLVPAGVRS